MPVLWSFRSEEKWKQLLLVGSIFLVLFLLEKVGWAGVLKSTTTKILQPLQLASMNLTHAVELPVRLVQTQQVNEEELKSLKNSYAKSLAELSDLESLKKENEALHQLLDKQGSAPQKRILAVPIISYSLTAIARGSEDGISVGQLVFLSDTFVGRITDVSPNQATVTLFSNPESEPILVETESHVQGILIGTGKQVKMTQLPTQAVIKKDERITTVGQVGIPPGLFLGVVATIDRNSTAPVQTVLVDQLNSFYSASIVEVR